MFSNGDSRRAIVRSWVRAPRVHLNPSHFVDMQLRAQLSFRSRQTHTAKCTENRSM